MNILRIVEKNITMKQAHSSQELCIAMKVSLGTKNEL